MSMAVSADTGNTGSENKIYRLEEPYFVEDRDLEVEAELKFRYYLKITRT